MWHVIQKACKENYEYFDFGKSSVFNTGLIEYKRNWGAEETDITHLYYPEIDGLQSIARTSMKYKLMNLIWGNSPPIMTRLGGKWLYKHLG
jgi:hypothetical protein